MKFNNEFARIFQPDSLGDVSYEDVPVGLRPVLEQGWCVGARGAWVLRSFDANYHGDRSSFDDLTGLEAAVNGRGIPDMDLSIDDDLRIQSLVRRGYAFACSALAELSKYPDHPNISAYISITRSLMDDERYTGSMTFCASRDGEAPYIPDIEKFGNSGILILESSECASPMPRR